MALELSNKSKQIGKDIEHVLQEIKKKDALIRQLNDERAELSIRYEELKAERQTCLSESLASERDWENDTFTWTAEVTNTLHKVFKLQRFRPQQLQTINCILSKKDVLLIAPTGGGKSLCFQLPAIIGTGLTIVVSPLISLMEDQVWSLKRIGIGAELLSATTDKNKNNVILKQMMDKSDTYPFKLLYVTPERLAKSKRFMNALQKCYLAQKLNMIAIDEVHCCSQWGHDFRPDYKFLGTLKTMFPDIPILGVTATATAKVILDVQKMLNIHQSLVLKAPFNRPNLYYHVMEKPSDKEQCIDLIYDLLNTRYKKKTGIIYAFSQADTEEISSALVAKGLKVRPYHAALTADRRTKIHMKWVSGEIQAVVATVAFGMGIDKPNVRFIIHHTLSKSMENFYQESGRGGRDGARAECVLLYRFADMFKITTMMFTEHTGLKNAYEMIAYATDGISCRRDLIAKHFMEVWNDSNECNDMCDRCHHKNSVNPPKMVITEHCLDLYKIIDRAVSVDVKLTGLKLVDAWYHKGATNLRVKEIAPPKFERYYAEQIIAFLIVKKFLKEDFHFSAYTTYSYIRKGARLATSDDRITFYGARVLNLPKMDEQLWSAPPDEDCVFISEEKIKLKKPKKEKRRKSKNLNDSVDSSFDDSSSIASSQSKRKRNDTLISSENGDSEFTPEKIKKKHKMVKDEIKELRIANVSSNGELVDNGLLHDDVQVLTQKNVIIEIDDDDDVDKDD